MVLWQENGWGRYGDIVPTNVTTTFNFGGRPSQALSNLAKLETSKLFIKPINEAAHINLTYSLTDDILLGTIDSGEMSDMEKAGLRLAGFNLRVR